MRQRRGEKEQKSQNNNDNEQPQDFSEPLSPEEAVMTQEPVTPVEPEPAPTPTPELQPAETPSTSNNALIMQIKILSEYAKDIKRSMYAVSKAVGVHHEYVRKAVANLVTAVVEHNGDPEALAEIYIEGSYSLKPQEISKLVVLADNLVNRNQSLEDAPDGGFQQNRPNEGSINRHYNKNTGNRRMHTNNNSPFDYYGQQQQPQQQQQQQRPQQVIIPPQQQPYPQEQQQQTSRYQQEMQKNMINEEKIAQMSMEEIEQVEEEEERKDGVAVYRLDVCFSSSFWHCPFFNEINEYLQEYEKGQPGNRDAIIRNLLSPKNVLSTWEGGQWGIDPNKIGEPYGGKCIPKDVEHLAKGFPIRNAINIFEVVDIINQTRKLLRNQRKSSSDDPSVTGDS
jgi:hypothetical protein